jgi:hypothetical protein
MSFARLVLLVLCMGMGVAQAQPSFPPPSGVYCSCGPTTGAGNGSVDPAVAAKPFVKGILVRVGWELVEPADDTYNWALIDGQITAAKQYGKKISLGVGCGIAIPQWVFGAGANYLVSTMPYNDTIALPWDITFLTKWTDFISALGSRYKNDTTIQLVYMTNSTANGYEMQLPFATTPTLVAAGYTDYKMILSWQAVTDAFNMAFPNHYLSNDFHPVNGSNAVADSVYAYARQKIGARYGANAWWWTQKNTTVYPSQYNILKNSAANNVFTGVQFANNGTDDSAKFGPGGMPAALQLAKDDGICYWEIWNQDILNAKFDTLLSNAACIDAPVAVKEVAAQPFAIYPNPAQGVLHIQVGNSHAPLQLRIINPVGVVVWQGLLPAGAAAIDIGSWVPGVYYLYAGSGYRAMFIKQ